MIRSALCVLGVLTTLAGSAVGAAPLDEKPAKSKSDDPARIAKTLCDDLERISKDHAAALANPWLAQHAVPTHFNRATREASTFLIDDRVNRKSVVAFHLRLWLFKRAVDDLPKFYPSHGWEDVRTREKPKPADLRALSRDLSALVAAANAHVAFKDPRSIRLGPESSLADAARYGDELGFCLETALFEKPLETVTNEGHTKTNEALSPSLATLRAAFLELDVSAKLDPKHPRISPLLKPALQKVRARITETLEAGDEFVKNFRHAADRVETMSSLLEAAKKNLKSLEEAYKTK